MRKKRQTDAIICLFLVLSLSACSGTRTDFSGGSEYELTDGTESEGTEQTSGASGQRPGASGGVEQEPGAAGGTEQTPGASGTSGASSEAAGGHRTVCVYLCGEVVNPGVYTLPEGSRLCDGIAAAGGMTEQACQEYWNLAEVLTDGMMIYVPDRESVGDELLLPGERPLGSAGGTGGAGSTGGTAGGAGNTSASGRVNLNTATEAQLMTLPGIGAAKAAAIVAYRTEHGRFREISELKQVPGIKDGVYRQVEELITVN